MDRYKAYLLPGAAALLVLSYYVWRWTAADDVTEPAATPASKRATETKATNADPPRAAPAEEPTERVPEPGAAAPAPAPGSDDAPRARDRARRDALREQIVAAQRARTQRKADEPSEPETVGELPKEYLRQRIREDLVPLALECYSSALEDDEKLAGKLVYRFRIVGEPDVGGIVEDAQLAPEDSSIQHAELIECMRESLMTMTFDPPENGGVVDVTYPFEFAPGEPGK